MKLKAFGSCKFDQGTIQLCATVLRGKDVLKRKAKIFTVGSPTTAAFVLPVRHGTGIALQRKRKRQA